MNPSEQPSPQPHHPEGLSHDNSQSVSKVKEAFPEKQADTGCVGAMEPTHDHQAECHGDGNQFGHHEAVC